MKVLITGQHGQLARSLAQAASTAPFLNLSFAARPALDLCDPQSLTSAIARVNPDVIINAAAYTAVDQAESEPELARQINAVAPGVLAQAASGIGARVIQISTDYVFDGTLDRAYRETDPVAPLGVYGRTKCAGEEAVRGNLAAHTIVRTAWVYSPFGKNFVLTMLKLARTRDTLGVVDDQIGTPTSALDLAAGLMQMMRSWRDGSEVGLGETYHLAGPDEMTWCGFASEIFRQSERRGAPVAEVEPLTSDQFPTQAKRPMNSRLDASKFERDFGFRAPPLSSSLGTMLDFDDADMRDPE